MDKFTSKIKEFEKRIVELEKKSAENIFNFIRYESAGKNGNTQEYEFSFKTSKECVLRPKITIKINSGEPQAEISVNGITVKTVAVKDVSGTIECCMPFAKGDNAVKIKLFSDSEYDCGGCVFEIFGSVDYPDKQNYLSVLNEENRSVILFVSADKAYLKIYANGKICDANVISDLRSCAICSFNGGYMLVCADKNGTLTAKILNSDLQIGSSVYLDDGVSSACCFAVNAGVKIYAVRGVKVVCFALDEQLNSVRTDTGYRAKKVIANPEVEGCLILTDFDGNNKLVAL